MNASVQQNIRKGVEIFMYTNRPPHNMQNFSPNAMERYIQDLIFLLYFRN